jgi:hypothetical protein
MLAEAACLSPHHFHRIFSTLMGETVHASPRASAWSAPSDLHARGPPNPGSELQDAWATPRFRCSHAPLSADTASRPPRLTSTRTGLPRPDRDAAHAVSAYFLRPAESAPADFAVELRKRPSAHLVTSAARGGYIDPAAVITAYERLITWAEHEGLPVGEGRLSGASRDDPEVTPLSHCRYRFALEVDAPLRPPSAARRRNAPGWLVGGARGGRRDAGGRPCMEPDLEVLAAGLRTVPAGRASRGGLPQDRPRSAGTVLTCTAASRPTTRGLDERTCAHLRQPSGVARSVHSRVRQRTRGVWTNPD